MNSQEPRERKVCPACGSLSIAKRVREGMYYCKCGWTGKNPDITRKHGWTKYSPAATEKRMQRLTKLHQEHPVWTQKQLRKESGESWYIVRKYWRNREPFTEATKQ